MKNEKIKMKKERKIVPAEQMRMKNGKNTMRCLPAIFLLSFFCFLLSCNNFVTDILPVRGLTGAPVEKPAVVGLPAPDSITIEKVAVLSNTGQAAEYAVSTSDCADPNSLSWQPFTTFRGLCSGTGYYVYARAAATPSYNAGPPTVSDYICFYTVYFRGNDQHGGEAPGSQTALEDSIIIIPGWGGVYRNDSVPGSWNTKPDGTGINYVPGQPYSVIDDEELYIRWFAGQTPGFVIDLVEDSPPIATGMIISQTGTDYPVSMTMTISNFEEFTSVEWIYNSVKISGAESYTIFATDIKFNEPGTHVITIIGYKGVIPFSWTVSFVVVP